MRDTVKERLAQLRLHKSKQHKTAAVLLALSLLVGIGVVWQLRLTGVTLTSDSGCSLEEHTHTAECTKRTQICGQEEAEGHTHSDACYQEEKVLACEQAEHKHSDGCYGEDGELVCNLEEHKHNDDCYTIERVPTCDEQETTGHKHTDDCYEVTYTCGKKEHTHDESCGADTGLTEEEQKQVDDVISIIEGLPPLEEIDAEFERLAGDPEALAAFKAKYFSAIQVAIDEYEVLTDAQKEAVTNADKLPPYREWLEAHSATDENGLTAVQYTDGTYTERLENPDVTITLEGDLPEGAEVRSYPVEFSMGEDAPVLCAQDITIFQADGETEYQPKTPVTVKFSGLKIPSHQELDVFHDLEDKYGGMERMKYTIDGDTVTIQAESFSTYAIIDAYKLNRIAESANNPGIIDNGWINYWSTKRTGVKAVTHDDQNALAVDGGNGKPSDEQVTNRGGSKTDGTVTVSKTIQGTDVENVFDITLAVNTTTDITEIMKDPDMAVVIVMDISNTMKTGMAGGKSRYQAAVESAESFIDKFAASNNGYSRIGFVAFNTHAHEVFNISKCSTENDAIGLKDQLREKTGAIINHPDYGVNWTSTGQTRYTNIEGGLKRASDMLNTATNKNKYIIFLSDGFPTTYISNGYDGYIPVSSSGTPGTDGVFYDNVEPGYCSSGTSYSDKAAIRAREMANSIKNSGTTIFSIGVDVGGQTITGYDNHRGQGWSVIDRTSETYEIGSATDANAFKNWLGNKIGSGRDKYYYDSTDTAGLQTAYDDIFKKIQSSTEQSNNLKWIASDPMPMGTQNNEVTMEFIGFFNKDKELQVYPPQASLTGSGTENAENTASFKEDESKISWDIKNSGYTTTGSGNSTTYHYTVTYRVRLKNELTGFAENQSYNTNGRTTLTYQEVTVVDGKETISGDKTIEFPIPAVKGYLGELTFKKVDQDRVALQGAEFELKHDSTKCSVCRGDGTTTVEAVANKTYTATSGTDGIVKFESLPSGHDYVLKETKAPAGYQLSNTTYSVKIAYDKVTVTENGAETQPWDLTNGNTPEVINIAGYELPNTGGPGTYLYTLSGLSLMAVALVYRAKRRRQRREGTHS